ncbi:hypothetical protein T484DRAFT_1989779, partial [Baffinella frigidus]
RTRRWRATGPSGPSYTRSLTPPRPTLKGRRCNGPTLKGRIATPKRRDPHTPRRLGVARGWRGNVWRRGLTRRTGRTRATLPLTTAISTSATVRRRIGPPRERQASVGDDRQASGQIPQVASWSNLTSKRS